MLRLIATVMAVLLLSAIGGLAGPEEAKAMLDGFGDVKLEQSLPAQIAVEPVSGDEVWRVQPGWVHRTEIQTYEGRDYDSFYRVQDDVVTEIYLRSAAEGDTAQCARVLDQLAKTYGPFDSAVSYANVSDFEMVRGVELSETGKELFASQQSSQKRRASLTKASDGRVLEVMSFSTPEGACFEVQISYRLEAN